MIKLAVPDLDKEELEQIEEVLKSKYIVQGKKVKQFEKMVSEYLKVKHAIAVSSGTAALHLALIALGIKSGDEVIVPDFTFPATSNVVELLGADTKLIDIKLDSFCIDVDQIEGSINEKTKAIIPVQEFGQSADMDKIMALANKYKLKVIEDAACALGAEYKGRKVGTIGDIGCFSFHPRKAITTGEGGMIVTNSDTLSEKVRILLNHGISYKNGRPEFTTAGFNYRMTDIQGAMGVAQMKKLEGIIKRRIEIAKEYNELLKNLKDIIIPWELKNRKHIYQTYHIIVHEKINRDELIKKLKEKGIETNFGAYAVHAQKYYKEKYQYDDGKFKNSYLAYKCGIALPLHNHINVEQLKYIVQILKEVVYE